MRVPSSPFRSGDAFSDEFVAIVEKVFKYFDKDGDGNLSFCEYALLYHVTNQEDLSKEEFDFLIKTTKPPNEPLSDSLSLQALLKTYETQFDENGSAAEDQLREELNQLVSFANKNPLEQSPTAIVCAPMLGSISSRAKSMTTVPHSRKKAKSSQPTLFSMLGPNKRKSPGSSSAGSNQSGSSATAQSSQNVVDCADTAETSLCVGQSLENPERIEKAATSSPEKTTPTPKRVHPFFAAASKPAAKPQGTSKRKAPERAKKPRGIKSSAQSQGNQDSQTATDISVVDVDAEEPDEPIDLASPPKPIDLASPPKSVVMPRGRRRLWVMLSLFATLTAFAIMVAGAHLCQCCKSPEPQSERFVLLCKSLRFWRVRFICQMSALCRQWRQKVVKAKVVPVHVMPQ